MESLPGDPEEAFSLLELKLRSQIPPHKELGDHDEQRAFDFERAEHQKQYVITLGAFANVYDIDVNVDFNNLVILEDYEFINNFKAASVKIQLYAQMCAFKLNARKRAGSTCIYVLTPAAKARIRTQIENIKTTLDDAEISDLKRQTLIQKLSAFAAEVEQDRTRLESLTSMYVEVKKEAKAAGKIVKPIEKLFDLVSGGSKELWKALPEMKITARLNPPQKKIEHQKKGDFDLDDEIPF